MKVNAATPHVVSAAPGREEGYLVSSDVVVLADSRPLEAEAVRTIRTHVTARHVQGGRRGLALCAPTDGVGCTFISVNLAASLAQVGLSTLLVDTNLRAPAVQEFIRPPTETVGVKQILQADRAAPRDFVHAEVLPGLSILYAGGAHDHAQELLGSESFKDLVDECLRDYDITIFDTPPSTLYADARRVNTLVGYGMIIARRNVTLMQDVRILAEQMREDGVELVGTVLNEV
jgi:Mrp family chromosome partitioning ATPase